MRTTQARQLGYWFELGFWMLMVRLLSRARLLALSPRFATLAQEFEGLRQAQVRQRSFRQDLASALAGWLCGLLIGVLLSWWVF